MPVPPPHGPPGGPAAGRPPAGRWTGSAAVPGARRDPTLDLPSGDGSTIDPADDTPVDPWADVSPILPLDPLLLPHVPAPPPAGTPPPAPPAATAPPRLPGAAALSPARSPGTAPLPVPLSPAGPAPAAEPARPKRSRMPASRPKSPPTTPPAGPLGSAGPVGRRRRRRWPWFLFLLLGVGCCGLPAYVVVPIFQQYPATVAVPAEVAGYQLRDDPDSTRVARELADTAGADDMFADDTFAAMYSGGPGHTVLVYGMTGLRFTPRDDLDATFGRLAPRYAVKTSEQVDAGPAGGHQRCGVGAGDGDDLVLCAWADHGSLGVATFSAGSVQRSAEVLAELRGQLLHRS